MRKILCFLLIIFFFAQGAVAAPLLKRLNQKHAGSWIKLTQSMVTVIELDINPTIGQVWEADLLENKNIKILGRQYKPSQPGLLGGGGVERIYIAGAKQGQGVLALALKRAYERGNTLRQLKFNFNSEGELNETFEMPKLNLATDTSTAGEIQSDGSQSVTQTEDDEPSIGVPQSYNWCDEYGCTPIKYQGNCGACWAFATVGVLENLIKIKDGVSVPLSEQYLISCNSDGYSCNGGWWAHDYHQWKTVNGEQDAGAVAENTKPYQARNGSCNSPNEKVAQIEDWGYVGGANSTPSADKIKAAVYEHGPVAAAVCVNSSFNYYSGGVYTGPSCRSVNHGVVIVGWNDSEGYWIIRNSYGESWGENGYMRIKYGVSNIGYGASWVDYQGSSDLPADSTTDTDTSSGQSDIPSGCDGSYPSSGGCN